MVFHIQTLQKKKQQKTNNKTIKNQTKKTPPKNKPNQKTHMVLSTRIIVLKKTYSFFQPKSAYSFKCLTEKILILELVKLEE